MIVSAHLQPFFRLPGRVLWGREVVHVEPVLPHSVVDNSGTSPTRLTAQ